MSSLGKNKALFIVVTLLITACAGSGDQFAEGLRVMTGRGGTVEKVDTFPDLKKQATEIAKTNPGPRWQKVFHADAADIFELLPGKRLLLGEVQVSSAIAEPEYGDLSLYDLKRNKKLWTVKRRDLEWGRYDVLSSRSQIILLGTSPKGGYYLALDNKTGRTIWEHDFQSTTRGAYDGANSRIYLLDVGKDKSRLRAVNSRNGKVLWQQDLRGVSDDARVLLQPAKAALYVLAERVYRIKTVNGAIEWQTSIPKFFDNWKTLQLRVTSQGVVLWDWRRTALLNATNGKLRWGPLYPSPPNHKSLLPYEAISNVSVPTRADSVFMFTTGDNVYRFDLRSGKKRWKYAKDKKDGTDLKGPFFYSAGKLYFSTYNSFTILDANTGKRLARFQFPFLESGLFGQLGPDIIIQRGNRVILAREGGAVYAFSKKTNKMLWKQIVNMKYIQFFYSSTINQTLGKVMTEQAFMEKTTRETAAWWSNWTNAVDFQWRGYQYKSSGAQLDSFGSSMVLFQSMLGLSDSIEKGLKQAAVEGLAERLNMELANAGKNHLRSIQNGYFIRPYESTKGMVVMLVNLDSGKRFDMVYSPVNVGMKYIDMRLPTYLVDKNSGFLYTTEIGVKTGRYEKYVKFKYGMPYPSILQYKLSDMNFR